MTKLPFITCGKTRLLNLPYAEEVIREVWDEDCYRLNEIPDGSIVLDVGAFYGEFGLICAVNKGCTVWAYEPTRANLDISELNRAINRQGLRHTIYHSAIGSSRSSLGKIYYRPDHPAGSGMDQYSGSVEEPVYVNTLDFELDRAIDKFGERIPITVKLDCEGSEAEIFKDESWIPHVDIVTMEWHNHDGDFYAGILEKHGFNVELEAGGPKPRPKWDKSIGGGLLFAKRKTAK